MKEFYLKLKTIFLLFLTIGFNSLYGQILQRGTVTSSGASNVTTITIAKPTGVIESDIMIIQIAQVDNNSLSNPTLAGWTTINGASNNNGATDRRITAFYKVASNSEPAFYTFALNNSFGSVNEAAATMVAFSGTNCTTPIDAISNYWTDNGTTISTNTLTTTTANADVIMLGVDFTTSAFTAWTTTSPGTLTELYDLNNASNISLGAAWATKTTAGNTGFGFASVTNGRNAATLIALRRGGSPTITSFSPTSGCPGTSVTINGTNLSGASNVTIGGAAATITSSTCTSITATINTAASGTSSIGVTASGGSTTSASTFSVPAQTITLTSSSSTTTQTTCINTPITNITYSIGGSGTNASVSGLPTGLTGNYSSGTYTISGSPSTAGTFNYTVTTSGSSCSPITSTGTITVIPSPPTITTNPSNSSISAGSNTSFTVSATNSPTSYTWQVSTDGGGIWNTISNGGVYTNATTATLNITGATIGMDGYIYRASASNSCGVSTYSTAATLTVTLTYCTPTTSSSTMFINALQSMGTLNDVTSASAPGYSTSGYGNYTATTLAEQVPGGPVNIYTSLSGGNQRVRAYVDWNKDGSFNTTDEEVYTSGNIDFGLDTTIGFIIPTGQTPGNYRLRIRSTGDSGTFTSCTTTFWGETEDYTLKVVADCSAKIATISNGTACGPTSSVTLTATGTAGTTGFYWYTTATGGTGTFTATGSWNTPVLAVGTTKFYVTAYNGSCESKFRTEIKATVKSVPALSFSNPTPIVCGQNDILTLSATGNSEEVELLNETFESGLGLFTSTMPTATNAGTDSQWSIKPSPYQPVNTIVWKPAISSGLIGDRYALAVSDYSGSNIVTNLTQTGSINTTGYTSLFVEFKHYYSFYSGDSGDLQVSTDGGTTWTTPAGGSTTSDIGTPAAFVDKTVDLSAYINQANLKIRFRYTATVDDGWAIDDVRIYGNRPLLPNFTWSGGVDAYTDAACNTPYTAGTTASTVYIKPTLAQLKAKTYNVVANVNLTNGCTTSGYVTVTNKSKVWTGEYSNDWNYADNWSPNNGIPDANTCVIIPAGTTTEIINAPTAYAKNLDVQTGGTLDVKSNRNLVVTDWIKTNGTFTVRNGANLVQVTDAPTPANSGTGTFTMQRTAKNIDYQDFVDWSSPVQNFHSTNISPTTTNVIFKWLPTSSNTNNYGIWASGRETMVAGKGYTERKLNTQAVGSGIDFTANFIGQPNNGVINIPIERGTYDGVNYTAATGTQATKDDDNWNFIGNPYPSSISAAAFLLANQTNLDGFIEIWKHDSDASTSNPDPYYQDYAYNYSLSNYFRWNRLGPNDASVTSIFDGYIGAGQGFYVLMKHTSPATTANATFTNSMRNASYRNDQFFRTSSSKNNIADEVPGKYWLNIVAPNKTTVSTLIGYTDEATNNVDQMFDAKIDPKIPMSIYSFIENVNEKYTIQGRNYPFDNTDKIKLGFKTNIKGMHKIELASVKGFFKENQDILLVDNSTNTTHNLKSSPYSFTSEVGEFNNRFEVKYTDQKLSNDDEVFGNSIKVYGKEQLIIKSELYNLKNVIVYDVSGKTLLTAKDINLKENSFDLKPTNSALLVKITLENGAVVTKKIIY